MKTYFYENLLQRSLFFRCVFASKMIKLRRNLIIEKYLNALFTQNKQKGISKWFQGYVRNLL